VMIHKKAYILLSLLIAPVTLYYQESSAENTPDSPGVSIGQKETLHQKLEAGITAYRSLLNRERAVKNKISASVNKLSTPFAMADALTTGAILGFIIGAKNGLRAGNFHEGIITGLLFGAATTFLSFPVWQFLTSKTLSALRFGRLANPTEWRKKQFIESEILQRETKLIDLGKHVEKHFLEKLTRNEPNSRVKHFLDDLLDH